MIAGLYRPGTSPLHRLGAGTKLAALVVVGTLAFTISGLVVVGMLLCIVLALYALARLPIATVRAQLQPIAWILLVLFAVQAWVSGPAFALLVVLRVAALVLAASLVTLTTRTRDLVDVVEKALRPLSRLGVDPRKTALAISLAIRFIPSVRTIVEEVREAQRARGCDRSMVALAVPVVVRLLKMTDEVAEAIDARSGD